MTNKHLALFDFDGTLTWVDSFFLFILYTCFLYPAKLLKSTIPSLFILLKYRLGLIGRHEAKEQIFKKYFRGTPELEYQKICSTFVAKILPLFLKTKALNKFKKHIHDGHSVWIVSASPETYLKKIAEQYSSSAIGTQENIINALLSGKFHGQNCWGEEKLKRIKAVLNINEFEEIHVYGNSKGDCNIFSIATHKYYKVFDSINTPKCK